MRKIYKTGYYQKLGLSAATYFGILSIIILIIIYIIKESQSKTLSLFLSFLIPILFIGVLIILKKKRMQNVTLTFDNLSFSITLYESHTNSILNTSSFLWSDIDAYRFYFDSKNNTCLTLYLKDKSKKVFIFNDKKDFKSAAKSESVFSIFYSYLNSYNLNQEENKIHFKPSLLATKTGLYIILFEVVLIITALIIHFIKGNFSNSYYLLIASGILIPQIISRNQNRALCNEITKITI